MAVIALDLDNTLVQGDKWLPGAQSAIKLMREAGHKVIIHSCNSPKWAQRLIDEAGLIVDGVWNERGKPLADLYVDDRGFRFKDWETDLNAILMRVHDKDNRKW